MAKQFRLDASEIRNVLPVQLAGCFATDAIMVDGMKVGYMYREPPDHDADSGWRFMSGSESQEYMDDADNLGLYAVNTVANYDPEIVPYVYSAVGSAFERDSRTGKLAPVGRSRASGFAQGSFHLPGQWEISLPVGFCVRAEDDALVIWRDGLTLRASVFRKWFMGAGKLLKGLRNEMSPEAQNENIARESGLIRHSYEVMETDPEHDPEQYTCLISNTLARGRWLLLAIYCDTPAALSMAYDIHASVRRK